MTVITKWLSEFLYEPDDFKETVIAHLNPKQLDVLRKFVGQETSYDTIKRLTREVDEARAKVVEVQRLCGSCMRKNTNDL